MHVIDSDEIWLKLNVDDPRHVVQNSEEAIERLILDINEYKPYGWYLNDYDLNKVNINENDKVSE